MARRSGVMTAGRCSQASVEASLHASLEGAGLVSDGVADSTGPAASAASAAAPSAAGCAGAARAASAPYDLPADAAVRVLDEPVAAEAALCDFLDRLRSYSARHGAPADSGDATCDAPCDAELSAPGAAPGVAAGAAPGVAAGVTAVVGLDCEWVGGRPVSLLQLAAAGQVLLLRLHTLAARGPLPPSLTTLMEDSGVLKAGVGVGNDLHLLQEQYNGWHFSKSFRRSLLTAALHFPQVWAVLSRGTRAAAACCAGGDRLLRAA